jgi:hypothetical protein
MVHNQTAMAKIQVQIAVWYRPTISVLVICDAQLVINLEDLPWGHALGHLHPHLDTFRGSDNDLLARTNSLRTLYLEQ